MAGQQQKLFGYSGEAEGFFPKLPAALVAGIAAAVVLGLDQDGVAVLGIVAAGSMLLILFFLTEPLAYVPSAALAAVIMVSAAGLFDLAELRSLYTISHRELLLSVGTTLGVLILGVLPWVLLAVALSLFWLLAVVSRPRDGVLGRVAGMKGFHSLADYPEATTIPGLVIYRFDANLVFFNADYFRERVRAVIAAAKTPVEWVVIDASSINVIDVTALQKIEEFREELAARGIVFAHARAKRNLARFFRGDWLMKRRALRMEYDFATIKSAERAFKRHKKKQAELEHHASQA